MKVHDLDVSTLVELTPAAKAGGGFHEGYAYECICLFAEDDVDLAMLRMKVLLELPAAIDKVLPLDNDRTYGWDDAHTMMALVPANGRGIIKLEQGMNNPQGERNDCFYVRFFAFKSADVPVSGPSRLVVDVSNSIKDMWPDTKVMSDTDRRAYSKAAKTVQQTKRGAQAAARSGGKARSGAGKTDPAPVLSGQKSGGGKLTGILATLLVISVLVTAGVLIFHFTQPSSTPVSTGQTGPAANRYVVPPPDMPDCATIDWSYGGSYPTAVAFGKWSDPAGGQGWLLICQGSSGYGISRGGAWAHDALSFFEIIETSAGVFQTSFTGGDLGGMTVWLSPDGTYQVSGGSTQHLRSTSGWQPLVDGFFPLGGSSVPGGQQTALSNDAATRQVLGLQSLVWQNATVRPSLTSYIKVCDSAGIRQVLVSRQDFLAAVQATAVDKIPSGSRLQSVLESAIKYSIQSDQSYLDWALRGCPNPVPVLQSDTDAGDAKDQFVAMWNAQIVGRFSGAEKLSTSQL